MTQWKGEGHFMSSNNIILYSGSDAGCQSGVAIVLNPRVVIVLISYNPISPRMVHARVNTKPTITNLIQVYAPTLQHNEDKQEDFYDHLQSLLDMISDKKICILIIDFIAKVGIGVEQNSGIGPFGICIRNEAGNRLAEFCSVNNLILCNTFYKHHPRQQYIWISPDLTHHNQIDYIAIRKKWKDCENDSKS